VNTIFKAITTVCRGITGRAPLPPARSPGAPMNEAFFEVLSDALVRHEHRNSEISRISGINVPSLYDLRYQRDEWYVAVSLGKLRVLCALLDIDFEEVFGVMPFDEAFERLWRETIAQNKKRLKQALYMEPIFFDFLETNVSMLDLYPIQWTEDIAREAQFDVKMLLSLLREAAR
jgi:hypothetical protein